jgi:hypothetical protein
MVVVDAVGPNILASMGFGDRACAFEPDDPIGTPEGLTYRIVETCSCTTVFESSTDSEQRAHKQIGWVSSVVSNGALVRC